MTTGIIIQQATPTISISVANPKVVISPSNPEILVVNLQSLPGPAGADGSVPEGAINSAGVYTKPTLTNNGNGTISLGAGEYILFDNTTFSGVPSKYAIGATGIITLTDEDVNYIVARHNNGTPEVVNIGSDLAQITDSDVIPIFTIFRTGNYLHQVDWGEEAKGMASKLMRRFRRTQRFHVDNGVVLSVDSNGYIQVSSGAVWMGANQFSLAAYDSSTTDLLSLNYHSAGVWLRSSNNKFVQNSQYDDGNNLQPLSDGNYAVNWVYRGVESPHHCYIVLGQGDYNLTEAQASSEPPTPPIINYHGMLVAKIIIAKNSYIPVQIYRVSQVVMNTSLILKHGDLLGLDNDDHTQYFNQQRGDERYAKSNLITEAANSTEETNAFANGAMIVIRTDLL
jgi:hypothetical protein